MFNPAASLDVLDWVIDKVDLVLVMSVNPGFGGQSFIPSALKKIERVRQRIDASGRDIRLEVDGGIKVDNIRAAADAGCRHLRRRQRDLRRRRLSRRDRRDARRARRLSRRDGAPAMNGPAAHEHGDGGVTGHASRPRPRRTAATAHGHGHAHGAGQPRPRVRDRHRDQPRLRRGRGVLRLARRFAGAARRCRPQPRRRPRPGPRLGRRVRRPDRARRAPHLRLEAGVDPGRVRQLAAAAGGDRLARLGRARPRSPRPSRSPPAR